ncbi:hypothetical protein JOA01_06685 [Streptococcus parasuis]|uniref:DUF6625 family protein n=1 Tax=Streptococcus parasuis TaxID=1501662 RepID=UPI001C2BA1DF|nr:DUF6625 family protein [Streptococcus parasuis]MBV1943280.1 hypothetical protein [Streptococcus parasuis]MDG3180540.1 hypothetical protein [Streptococcus suis]QXF05006.1 hypothetical protein JOA01_06685 [Streptococcus parasuis]WDM37049.1 hypothetical protein KEM15_07080 [Streptococcus parasuis]
MKKIKIIIPYFGKFPKFFPYFLMTAKWNSKIDFLIVTDQELSGLEAFNINNITFQKTTLNELKEKIQRKFDFEVSLNTAYKLCDFKPAYGYIFSDECEGYDYWGFCDTDILLGDVYQFLEQHDFFNQNYDRYGLLGHLQIYKNSEDVNNLFKSGDGLNYRLNYKNVFTSSQNFIFDESLGIQKLFENAKMKQLQVECFDDIDISHFAFRRYGEEDPRRYYYWSDKYGLESHEVQDGVIIIKKPLYVHFQKRKLICPSFDISFSFYVVPNQEIHGEKLSKDSVFQKTKSRFYWEYKKYSFLKRFNCEKKSIPFILHKLKMKRG